MDFRLCLTPYIQQFAKKYPIVTLLGPRQSGKTTRKTYSPLFLEGLRYFHEQAPKRAEGGALIYGGDQTQKTGLFELLNPENCPSVMQN